MPASPISPLTRQLANAIGECCQEKRIQPYDLRSQDFTGWLKNEKGLESKELKDIQAHLSRVGGFSQLRNAFFVGTPTPSMLEKSELKGIAKLTKMNLASLATDEQFMARFGETMKAALAQSGRLSPFGYSVKPSKEKTARVVTLCISDTHFGSKLDPRELPHKYDFEEEARALSSVILRVCEFKTDYRDETELNIWIGGDLTRGKIHDRQAGRPGAEQAADAMWLLIQMIRIAAGKFKKVTVYCTPGNHDRDEARNPEGSGFDEKWDSRATVIYVGIKYAVDHLPNVTVHIPRTPYCDWKIFGHRVYATHGDDNLNPGNPGKNIDISRLDAQMKTINLGEVQDHHQPYDLFIVGHVHQGLHLPLPVAELLVNPALIPVDGYARGRGYASSRPGQAMFESTKDHIVGDHRFLFTGPEVRKDRSLDKIILPFKDF